MKPDLSLVMPFYRNPRMLHWHLLVWKHEWSAEVCERVEVVIVDDDSPADTAAEALAAMWGGDREGLPAIAVYRVKEDRPWHQHAARNLGAHVATTRWLLMTDMDHVIPPWTMKEVLLHLPNLDAKRDVLTFGRVDAPQTLTWKADHWPEFARTTREDGSPKPHVNSFVVSRDHYWKIGGYDEDLCGLYGTDKFFRDRLFGNASRVTHLSHAPLIRVDRSVIPDASTRDVERKVPGRNAAKKEAIRAKLERGEIDTIRTLQFDWERVA